ncbi:hypothetical protein ACEWY4_017261 [Coilia grayii]|uniref:Ig-like domain-containing protein n=1 Tax=Coilia grayii TaxID=363190 RepID=A0ABD1JGN2_9TELE
MRRLRGVSVADARKYYCRVVTRWEEQKWTGMDGVAFTVTELRVVSPGYLREGKAVTLTCATNCSLSGDPQFVWKKDGLQVWGAQGRSLHLSSLSSGDEGSYTCAVKNHTDLRSPPVALSILYSPRDVLVFARPSGVIVKGATVTLTCTSDANPPVDTYTWFKVNESTPVGSGLQHSLTNMSSEDGGQYYCEARNEVGSENSTFMAIKIADECNCPLSVSVGVSITCGIIVLACVFSFFIRYHCKKRGKTEDVEVEFDDGASGKSDQQEEDDYENCQYGNAMPMACAQDDGEPYDYEDCEYGNAMQMHSAEEPGEPYAFQDDDVYQNVDELCMG